MFSYAVQGNVLLEIKCGDAASVAFKKLEKINLIALSAAPVAMIVDQKLVIAFGAETDFNANRSDCKTK